MQSKFTTLDTIDGFRLMGTIKIHERQLHEMMQLRHTFLRLGVFSSPGGRVKESQQVDARNEAFIYDPFINQWKTRLGKLRLLI